MSLRRTSRLAISLFSIAGLAAGASAQVLHPEIEPNDNKAEAFTNGPFILAPGDGVTGTTTGNTAGSGLGSPDYFLIQTTPAPLGIYRNRMLLDNPAASWSVTLRGLSQSNGSINFVSDAVVQTGPTGTSAVPRRGIQWYSFGKEEQIVYRISGASSTTQDYIATLDREPVEALHLGTFKAGDLEITTAGQGHNTNSALWIFDSNLDIIPDFGNDQQPSPGTGNVSRLTRSFAPGTYYMALTVSQLAVPLQAPFDDRRQNAVVMEFPNAVAATTTATSGNLSFQVTDEYGPLQYTSARSESFQILWYTFEVGDLDPATLGRCCLFDGTCQVSDSERCGNLGGIFGGAGSTCAAGPCPQPGACCLPDYGCTLELEPICVAAQGIFAGENTTCTACPSGPCWSTDIGIPGAGPVMPNFQRSIYTLAVHNGQLFAGGDFTTMGGETMNRVARFDGTHWWPLGTGVGGTLSILSVQALASFDGDLYVAGLFDEAGGLSASRIARWDGELWHNLGSGLTGTLSPTLIAANAMTVFDDGTGPALYISGRFQQAGGLPVNNIARWDGTNFSAVGNGVPDRRSSLAIFQGHLYAAGAPFNNPISRWDGFSWSVPPGISLTSQISTMTVFDDGAGEALYFGTADKVFKYDGASLTDVTANLILGFFDQLVTLGSYDDGSGPALYAGGHFAEANNPIKHFARWNGTSWETVNGGVGGFDQPVVLSLLEHDGALYVAGRFTYVGGNPSNEAICIAILDCDAPQPCYANCDGSTTSPVLNVDDFTCFINEFATAVQLPHAQQIEHYANCDGSTTAPVLNVDDFTCFINAFAQGCP